MNLGWIAWLALQVAPAPTGPPTPDQAPQDATTQPAVAPYPGALADGLKELADHARAGENERTLELCAALLASPELGQLPEEQRARARYDVGLARALAGAHGDAVADLRAAAGLAGPGDLRAKSLYAAGTARLLAAEALRVQVPEIAKKLGLAPPTLPGMIPGGPPIPPSMANPDGAAPDPIELARTAYLNARTELLQRLKLDWRDADTRANLELVARRLRELDEIERQRKEEQQQQQQNKEQQQKQQDQQQKQQPQDQPQDQKQDPNQDQKPPEDQKSQEDQKPPEDGKDQPEKPPEPPKDQDNKDQQDPKEQDAKPDPAKMEEKVMSKEEVQRLLDRLQEIEDQAQALRALLRERRRVPVERDW